MKIVAFFLVLMCALARAQTVPPPIPECQPKTWLTPNSTDSELLTGRRLYGEWTAHWCAVTNPPGYPPGVYLRTYWWAGLYSYGWQEVPAAAERIMNADDPWEQAKTERTRFAKVPPVGGVDECRHKMLKREACMALFTKATPPYPTQFTEAELTARCGAAVDCAALPPPPSIWRVAGSGTLYNVTADGRRGLIIPGRTAPINGLCDCSIPILYVVGNVTSTFCPVAGAPTNEVTMCRKVAS